MGQVISVQRDEVIRESLVLQFYLKKHASFLSIIIKKLIFTTTALIIVCLFEIVIFHLMGWSVAAISKIFATALFVVSRRHSKSL